MGIQQAVLTDGLSSGLKQLKFVVANFFWQQTKIDQPIRLYRKFDVSRFGAFKCADLQIFFLNFGEESRFSRQ